ncbi:MAG: DedA family protein [Polyangiaceae bacterium]
MPVHIYFAVFLATLGTTVLPVPEEAALLAAGYAARTGNARLLPCIAVALLAVLVGDITAYLVGRGLLGRLLRTGLGAKLWPERRREWAERLVATKGARAVVVARFLVGLRGFVYFALGASRYPFARFLAVDTAAGVVEVGGLVVMGFAFGELRGRAGTWVDLVAAAILVATLFGPATVRALAKTEGRAR